MKTITDKLPKKEKNISMKAIDSKKIRTAVTGINLEYKPNQLGTGNQFLLEYKPRNTLPVVYKAENTALVLYKNPNLFAAPVATNGSLVTAPLLLTDGTNKVSQVQNSMLPNKAVLTLPVKYPIITESGVTIYPDYATGIRGGEYEEAGITKDSNYIDITLQKSIKGKEVIVRINTVDIDKNGNYNYYVEDKQGFLQFFPSGIFENSNCIKKRRGKYCCRN
ncbi:hypothetical protein IX329_002445 [Fusobacterium necrophorum]|nr:hypothetical protein [Fusobacterium necrophorum]MBR8734830.1 hypothetical protein [Fusobacterium necrophorum]MBR8790998.1 hypothetical protein [Fusobacterium necrophorum]MCF0163609.1 hypothetical protein [Fusobacterium necrophorum]